MIIKQNLKANFWIRILATLIDLLFFITFAISTSFIVFNYKNTDFYTTNKILREILHRLWFLILIAFIILWYIVIPIFSKGQSVGMLITKTKIVVSEENSKRKFSRYIFDRQRLFSVFWICILLSFMLISGDAFIKAAKGKKLNTAEKLVFSIPSILATIAINLEVIIIITGVGPKRINWNDKLSKTITVWKNKYEEIEIENHIKNIFPKKRELPKFTYINS